MPVQREFKQRRAAATYEALLAAAARVFARRGFEAAQTPEIASEAGVSTGAFYRYFEDKRAVFVEVVAQHLRTSHEAVLAKLTPERFAIGDQRATIDMVLEVLFERVRRDAPLERVYLALSYTDPDVMRLRAEYEGLGCTALARLLEQIATREAVPDALAAARVISIAAVEIAADRAGLRPRLATGAGDAAVKTALRDMLYRYIFPGGATSPSGAARAVATSAAKPAARRARPKR
jgi:AcrR family transcriptional regulator